MPVDMGLVHYREVNVAGSSGGSPWDMARTLELIARGDISTEAHITCMGDLEHAPALLQMVKAHQLDGKAVVYPHRRTGETLRAPAWSAEDGQRYLANSCD